MMEKYREIGCELKTTIAATTLSYFETNFYGKRITHPFPETKGTTPLIDFFHRGYYGGRTEIFHNLPVTGTIWYHDINSLYPSVLRNCQFPVLEHYYETKKPDFGKFGMADCEIQAPKGLCIPYLPHKSDQKLFFPLGCFRGVYTYFELKTAITLGYRVLKVYRAIEFPTGFNPFAEFIERIYSARLSAQKQGDELLSQTYKAFGNYSYGKYAQKNESTELVPLHRLKEIPDGTVILGGDLALIKSKIPYPRYANCIWACYTTAYARDVLYRGLTQTQAQGGLLLYCDTDSVIYERRDPIFPHSTKLGEFKCEGRFRYAHFKLPKLYCLIPYRRNLPHVYKAKGVPGKAKKRFFKNQKARYKKPNKLREALRRNLSPNKKYDLIPNYWETREKEITGKYDKRVVRKDGSTTPLILGESHGTEKKEETKSRRPLVPRRRKSRKVLGRNYRRAQKAH